MISVLQIKGSEKYSVRKTHRICLLTGRIVRGTKYRMTLIWFPKFHCAVHTIAVV